MKKLWLFLLLAVVGSSYTFAQQFAIDTVYFDFDSDRLKAEYQVALDSLIAKFSGYPAYYVEITGHTDSIGSDEYNQDLSERRALSVYSYLVQKGLHPNRMSYEGFGTRKPVAPNNSFLGRSKNRRADIAVIFSSEPLEPPIAENTEEEAPPAEPEVDPGVPVEQQAGFDALTIDPRATNIITGPQGTRITIPPNVFETNDTQLSFEIKELYNKKDIILSAMPTIDKNGPLETAGMVEVEVRNARRRPVRLKQGMALKVEMPTTRREPNMAVYRGSGGSSSGSRSRGSKPAPVITPVRLWQLLPDVAVGYRGNMYEFQAPTTARFNVARPLHYATNTDEDDPGVDFTVKLKGKRFERNTSVMLVGEVVRTFIPFTKQSTRVYRGKGIKYLADDTKLVLIAIQYDNDDTPYFAKREFKLSTYVKKKKKGPATAKLKMKFRKLNDYNELVEKVSEL